MLAMKLVSAREETYDMSDSVTLMRHLGIEKVEELYGVIEKYEFPLHPTALGESIIFAKRAFDEYIKDKNKSKKN